MSTKLTQHELRQHAVQALFMLEVRDDGNIDAAIDYSLDGSSIDNIENLKMLVTGVSQNEKKLDAEIRRFLNKDWTLDRLTVIDKTILRLGVYELLETETPDVVAVDEAVNLAHDYSDDSAGKLINGILTNLIKK